MLSTFAINETPEPRYRLREGITTYYVYPRPTKNQSTFTLPEIPKSAPIFAQEALKFPIDPLQQEILSTTHNRVVICSCRQWGKSTTGAIKALHHALTHPGSLTLIASKSLRQAGELLDKAIDFARQLDIPIRHLHRHRDSLVLPNHSRIIALPGKPDSLRGLSAVTLLIVDEAAYVADELYFALRPMLATTNGDIWLLSTARHRGGFFYEEWSTDSLTWTKFRVTADDCPRINKEFLQEERRANGPAIFNREYYCDFGYTGQCYFDIGSLDLASDPNRYLAAQHFAYGRPTTRIIIGFDLGQKASHPAVVALEVITGATDRLNPVTFERMHETRFLVRKIERMPLNMPYDSIMIQLNRIVRDLGDPRIISLVIDATGCGQPFVEILRRQKMGVLIHAIGITSGSVGSYSHGTDRVPKKDLMASAKYVMASDVLAVQPGMPGLKELREEMEAFRIRTSRAGGDSFRAGEKDDLVMAFALAAWRARQFLPKADTTQPETIIHLL